MSRHQSHTQTHIHQGDSQLDCEECTKARADRGLPGKVKVDAIKYERIKVADLPRRLVFVDQIVELLMEAVLAGVTEPAGDPAQAF